MSHDPDPEVLLRITVCQRNKDHWLGSCVRITYNKNPALTNVINISLYFGKSLQEKQDMTSDTSDPQNR